LTSDIRPKHRYMGTPIYQYLFCESGLIQTSCIVINTNIAKYHKFNPNLRKHQDYDFCINLWMNKINFFHFEVPLVFWDQTSENRISLSSIHRSEEWINPYKKIFDQKSIDGFNCEVIYGSQLRSGVFLEPVSNLIKIAFRGNIKILAMIKLITEYKFLRPIKIIFRKIKK